MTREPSQAVWIHAGATTRLVWAATLLLCLVGLACLYAEISVRAAAASQSDASSPATAHDQTGGGPASQRLREGAMLVDQLGRFEPAGDRLTFVPSTGNARFVVLENLNLERIAQVLAENRDARQWSVSGTVMEYRGGNYLLVTRAILKSRSRQSGITP